MCGHATIAAHYIRAIEEKLETSRYFHKTGAGILPIDICKENGDYKIIMTQGKIEFGALIEGENKRALLAALKINKDALKEDYPIQIVSTGHSKVIMAIKDKSVLNRLNPNYDALTKLSEIINCNGYYICTINSSEDEDGCLVHGRMFAPAIGINEDPVTGNANGPLGAYLVQHKLIKHNSTLFKFKAKQGEEMGRTGIIEVEVNIENHIPTEVKISGNAVVVFQTEITL